MPAAEAAFASCLGSAYLMLAMGIRKEASTFSVAIASFAIRSVQKGGGRPRPA
jgi:hypothetical protein